MNLWYALYSTLELLSFAYILNLQSIFVVSKQVKIQFVNKKNSVSIDATLNFCVY